MGRLLLHVEATAHRHGWDGPPGLFLLYDWHDDATEREYREHMAGRRGAPTRCGRYAAQSMVPSQALDGFPQHGLFRMALNFHRAGDDPRIAKLLAVVRQPGFLGAAFLCESWARTYDDPEQRAADAAKRFADMPGSKECRNVTAADVSGQDYWVNRVRGDKPALELADPAANLREMSGSVIESLRTIVAAIAGLPMPPPPQIPSAWRWDEQHLDPDGAS